MVQLITAPLSVQAHYVIGIALICAAYGMLFTDTFLPDTFKIPRSNKPATDRAHSQLLGFRDMLMGCTCIMLAYLGHQQALGWLSVFGLVLGVCDGVVTIRQSGRLADTLPHWGTSALLGLLAYNLLYG